MINTYNKRIFIWIIVILAVINISTIGTIVYRAEFQGNNIRDNNSGQIEIPNTHLGRFIKNELNLTYEQHQQFKNIRYKFHEKANIFTNEMQVKRNEMMIELGKEKSDTIHLHTLAEEIGNLHEDLKYLTFEYYLDMKNICSEEQKKKLFQIFSAMTNQGVGLKMSKRKMRNFHK